MFNIFSRKTTEQISIPLAEYEKRLKEFKKNKGELELLKQESSGRIFDL